MPAVFAFTPKFQAFTSAGLLASGYKLFCYAAGTTTKQNSYTDSTGNSANTNPIVMDSRGEANVWLDTGLLYKLVLTLDTEADPPVNNLWSVDSFGFPQTITGPLTITGNLTVSGDLSVAGVSAALGKHAIPIVAASMQASATGGCAVFAKIASAADQPDITTLDFDATTQEYAQFSIPMPKSWNESTVTFKPVWSHAATTVNFGVVWDLQAVAISNDDAIAAAYGTAQTSTDTGGTTNDIYVGPESSAITIAGTPASEDVVFFRLSRVTGNASDTMAIDARLHGIVLYITTDANNDG